MDVVDGDRGAQATVIKLTGRRGSEDLPQRVVKAARQGDHRAFRRLVERYDDGLRRLAYNLLRSREEMDDALQEAYLNAYRGLPRFRGDADVGTWLYRIAYCSCQQRLRRTDRLEPTDDHLLEEMTSPSPDPADEVANRDEVHAALAALPEAQRAAVLLVLADGFSYASAAEILDAPVGTVASRVAAGRRALERRFATARSAEGEP